MLLTLLFSPGNGSKQNNGVIERALDLNRNGTDRT